MTDIKQRMLNYWKKIAHSGTTVEQMVLCSGAETVHKREVSEVLSLLGDISGKDVLELGAGIGRYTEHLAKSANNITCVDFIPLFNEVNRNNFATESSNVHFIDDEVQNLILPSNSFDVIFSNGLLMYMDDEDVRKLFASALIWLRPGGQFFFRETCFKAPDDSTVSTEGVHFRRPDAYNSLFQSVSVPVEETDQVHTFETVFSKSVQAYVRLKGSTNEICWLIEKLQVQATSADGFKTFQEFLDNKQYSRNGILRYERIFGTGFISTGGLETTKEFVKRLNLKPGEHVLDVGAGIGGGDFYMAQQYDVFVTGIDLSANMISIALENAAVYNDSRVQFEVCDATKQDYTGKYDVVYSRDTILHIKDKRSLFTAFLRWLKPGGRLLISDYSCTESKWSDQFEQYVAQRGYNFLPVAEYGKLLEEVGFVNVIAEDRTDQFVDMLKKELQRMNEIQEEFIEEFSETDFQDLVDGWHSKLKRCAAGDQKWGLFYAEKTNL